MTATVAVSRCAWCRRSLSVDGRGRKWCPDCTPEGTAPRRAAPLCRECGGTGWAGPDPNDAPRGAHPCQCAPPDPWDSLKGYPW